MSRLPIYSTKQAKLSDTILLENYTSHAMTTTQKVLLTYNILNRK